MAIGFGGTWFSTFGRLTLTEEGGDVQGSYEHHGGALRGSVDGRVLRGTWSEPGHGKAGAFELTLDEGGNTFRGAFRYDGSAGWNGRWDGVRTELPSEAEGGSPGAWNSLESGPLLAGPMLGEAGPTDARVWVQARDTSPLVLTVHGPDGHVIRLEETPSWDDYLCVVFQVLGLRPGAAYEYVIESRHGATPRHRLHAAPPAGSRRARIAFGSCFDVHDRPLAIFESIARDRPDVFLMIGDNCYYELPDWQTEHTMMLAQLRNRNSESLRPILAEVPTLGIWDDHDFGPNDTDGRFEGKDMALAAFERVWAQRSYGTDEATGIFSTVRWGPVEIFLLDGRYERLEYDHILGPAQLAWLKESLLGSDAPVKLVVSGSQLLPAVAVDKEWECWRRDAPGELEDLLAFLDDRGVRGVVFATGDVHIGYLLHQDGRVRGDGLLGPEIWELTASPLTSAPWTEHLVHPGQPFDPYIVSEHPTENYGILDVDLDRAGAEIHLILKDSHGHTLVAQPIALATLAPHPPPSKIVAAFWEGDRPRLVRGAPGETADLWPAGADAAVDWGNGKAYVFKGAGYVRCDAATGRVDEGYPRYVATSWPGLWSHGIDAGVVWDNGKAYFFRGSEYVRYDLAADRTDASFPKPIAGNWPGLWAEGIDAAMIAPGGKAYFFRGDECIRYDMVADQADPGYPRPIAAEFPGALPIA